MNKYRIRLSGIIRSQLIISNPPPGLRNSIENLLTFRNPEYYTIARFSPWGAPKSVSPTLCFLEEGPNGPHEIQIPRGFDSSLLTSASLQSIWNSIEWSDQRTKKPVQFPSPRLTLNNEQTRLYKDFCSAVGDNSRPFGNFLYVAPTSIGKTILQAMLARATSQRTLVLCLTDLIKKAWYDDLNKLFGLGFKDIGLIQKSDFRIEECFTLASVQTLIRRQHMWPKLNELFGTVIVDECQSVQADSVYEFLKQSPARFLIGATATPKKENLRLNAVLGSPRRRLFATYQKTQTSLPLKYVRVIPTSFEYDSPAGAIVQWDKLSEAIALDEERNGLIVREAKHDLKQGKSVLIVTKRTAHVHLLAELLTAAGIEGVNVMTGETNSDRNYTHRLVRMILDGDVRCLVATIPAIKLGANLNPLSSLHLAMPIDSDGLEQLIGRVRRRAEKKSSCGLVYYFDTRVPYLKRLFYNKATPVFRKLRVPGYANTFFA